MNVKRQIDSIDLAEQYVLSIIREEHPEWVKHDGTCERCEEYYKSLDVLIALDE